VGLVEKWLQQVVIFCNTILYFHEIYGYLSYKLRAEILIYYSGTAVHIAWQLCKNSIVGLLCIYLKEKATNYYLNKLCCTAQSGVHSSYQYKSSSHLHALLIISLTFKSKVVIERCLLLVKMKQWLWFFNSINNLLWAALPIASL